MSDKEKRVTADMSVEKKPLRLWPGVVIVTLQWLIKLSAPIVFPGAIVIGPAGGILGGLAVLVWWAFFSRAPRTERWGAVVLMIAAILATPLILHESIRTGMMGAMFYLFAIPVLSLAFVVWALISRRLPVGPRRALMVITILLACGGWAFVRSGGITGGANADLAWRWSKTPEERLLAQSGDVPMAPIASAAAESGAGWAGFRGPDRDGIIHGVRIETDWSASPPVELWRRPVGPGWSSFAVGGGLFYTQEQRGEDEVVSCYDLTTGKPVWRYSEAARFWESNSGPGPRGTPTLSDGRLYTFGATGILSVLDAVSGTIIWSRNAAADTNTEVPTWGFASSPLVVDDRVIVAAAGSLTAYDLVSGERRWFDTDGGDCYSSPHLLTIDGIPQVLLLNEAGVKSVAPADGTPLWEHAWSGGPILQPALTANGDVLISVSERSGIRCIHVAKGPGGWTAEERWTSTQLRPYFNDIVVHDGHVYGFDGPILACLNVEDGQRKWKGGRYGQGQLVLLADQDLLLVLSEKGELALVEAAPDGFTELARFIAITGKTWNHPVLVGDILLVRNAQEMAAFRLALSSDLRE